MNLMRRALARVTHNAALERLEAVLAEMYLDGFRRVAANTVAERLWPAGRRKNSRGQVFHLGAAMAARMLRRCHGVAEVEWRRWEILPPNTDSPADYDKSQGV